MINSIGYINSPPMAGEIMVARIERSGIRGIKYGYSTGFGGIFEAFPEFFSGKSKIMTKHLGL